MNSGSPPDSQNLMAPGWPTRIALRYQALVVVTKTQKSHLPTICLELLPPVSLLHSDHPPFLRILETRSLLAFSVGPALSPGLGHHSPVSISALAEVWNM